MKDGVFHLKDKIIVEKIKYSDVEKAEKKMKDARIDLFRIKLAGLFMRLIEEKLLDEKDEIKEKRFEQESIKSRYEDIKEEHVRYSI